MSEPEEGLEQEYVDGLGGGLRDSRIIEGAEPLFRIRPFAESNQQPEVTDLTDLRGVVADGHGDSDVVRDAEFVARREETPKEREEREEREKAAKEAIWDKFNACKERLDSATIELRQAQRNIDRGKTVELETEISELAADLKQLQRAISKQVWLKK